MTLRKSDILTAIVLIVLPIAAFFGFFQPRLSYIAHMKEDQRAYRIKLRDSETLQSQSYAARTRTAKMRAMLASYLGQAAGGADAFKAVDAIVQKAQENSVQIELIKPGTPVEGRVLDGLPILVTTSSQFTALHGFLKSVETGNMLITVRSLDIEADENGGCKARIELRINYEAPADRGRKA